MVASLFKKMKQQKPVRWKQYRVTCPCISLFQYHECCCTVRISPLQAIMHLFVTRIPYMGTTMEMVAAKAGCCKGRKELLNLTTIQKLQHQTTACSGDFFPHDKPKWCARNCVITQKFALCFIFFMMMMSMMIKIINNNNYDDDDDDGRRFHVLP